MLVAASRARARAIGSLARARSGAAAETSAPARGAPSLERWSADLMEVRLSDEDIERWRERALEREV